MGMACPKLSLLDVVEPEGLILSVSGTTFFMGLLFSVMIRNIAYRGI